MTEKVFLEVLKRAFLWRWQDLGQVGKRTKENSAVQYGKLYGWLFEQREENPVWLNNGGWTFKRIGVRLIGAGRKTFVGVVSGFDFFFFGSNGILKSVFNWEIKYLDSYIAMGRLSRGRKWRWGWIVTQARDDKWMKEDRGDRERSSERGERDGREEILRVWHLAEGYMAVG